MLKVVKFGGSSVANAQQFQKVKAIVDADPKRRVIVTSACGKSNQEDYKVTDLLYLIDAHHQYKVRYDSLFELIEKKYKQIVCELGLSINIEDELAKMRQLLEDGCLQDEWISKGEYLTAKLLAEYLDAEFVDAADTILFHYDGTFDEEQMEKVLIPLLHQYKRIVIPGFYGSLPNRQIKVMSRGGSDITGSILASVLNAEIYENWTDVNGFMVADPRIIPSAYTIDTITYHELRGMSYMGANVLHDDAVFPVKQKNIPINIRNTNDMYHQGTIIVNDCSQYDAINPPHLVTGIAGRKDFTIITMTKNHSSVEVGLLRKILAIFESYHVSVESVPATVDTFSVIVQSKNIQNCLYELLAKIKKECMIDEIKCEEQVALIAVVGRGMKQVPGSSGQFLSEFGRQQINIKVINQASDELTIVVGVDNRDFEKAIQCIYERFIKEDHQQ